MLDTARIRPEARFSNSKICNLHFFAFAFSRESANLHFPDESRKLHDPRRAREDGCISVSVLTSREYESLIDTDLRCPFSNNANC